MTPPTAETIARTPTRLGRWILLCALTSVVSYGFHLTVLPWITAAAAVVMLVESGRHVRDRLTLSPQGIDARWLLRRQHLDWDTVWALTEGTGTLGRRIVLSRRGAGKLQLPALRAPRTGTAPAYDHGVAALSRWSVAAGGPAVSFNQRPSRWVSRIVPAALVLSFLGAAALDQPWYWVALSEAAAPTDACAPLRATFPADQGDISPSSPVSGSYLVSQCLWQDGDDRVTLTIVAFQREGLISGSGVAAIEFRDIAAELRRSRDRRVAAPYAASRRSRDWGASSAAVREFSTLDIGDHALLATASNSRQLIAGRANVLIFADYDWAYQATESASMPLVELVTRAVDALVID